MESEETPTKKQFQPPSMIVENLSCEISAYQSEEDSSFERPLSENILHIPPSYPASDPPSHPKLPLRCLIYPVFLSLRTN